MSRNSPRTPRFTWGHLLPVRRRRLRDAPRFIPPPFRRASFLDMEEEDEVDELETGEELTVAAADDSGALCLSESALRRVLASPRAADRNVVLVAVAGDFRKGKSFLLNYLLRYLRAGGKPGWMGAEEEPLEGFGWRGGFERHTSGVLMWANPFVRSLPDGDEVAVYLMDTQGTFDSKSSMRECAAVFALSTMMSSVLVFNVLHNLQENDLQALGFFTEYGRLALSEIKNHKPFQHLVFLVRDWSYAYELAYGYEGGRKLLEKRLRIPAGQHPDLTTVRKDLTACFSNISCFLMPHPGKIAASDPHFDGRLSLLDPDFRDCMESFVSSLLADRNLVRKQIGASQVTSGELFEYAKLYGRALASDELPEPQTLLRATAEGNHLVAYTAAKNEYCRAMEDVVEPRAPYMQTEALKTEHLHLRDLAIRIFEARPKMGGEEMSEQYRTRLFNELEGLYGGYKRRNDAKSMFWAFSRPLALLLAAALFSAGSFACGVFGVRAGARYMRMGSTFCVMMLMLWVLVSFSGLFVRWGMGMDTFTEILWNSGEH